MNNNVLTKSVSVKSSLVNSADYDIKSNSLLVHLNSGASYKYFKVTPDEFNKFVACKSKGKFFNTKIKTTHKFKKVV